MADLHTKTHQKNPKTTRFLTCFGFSGKNNNPPEKKPIKTRTKNKSPSLSWPMFCFSAKKSRTKTVPVDNSEKADVGGEIHTPSKVIKKKSENKLPSRQNSKADHRQPASLIKQTSRAKTKEGPEPNIPIGNRKVLDPTRTGSSLPGSPTVKPKLNPKTHTKLSHTVSLPVLKVSERVGNPRIHHDRVSSKQQQKTTNGVVEKLDPLMGMSIIMVTLIIMLIWGRLCAVLCTSAWFYFRFRFRFRTTVDDNDAESIVNSNDTDSNSEEYKKKIVLEGLLERNRKVTF